MIRLARPFSEIRRNCLPLKPFFAAHRWAILIGLLSLLLVDFLQLLIPQVIRRAVDLLTQKQATLPGLLRLGAAIVTIALLMAGFRYLWRLLIFGYSRNVEQGLRNRMYAHLQTLSPSFYLRNRTGDLMARAVNDINAVRMATGMGLVALTDGLVLGLAAIGFMLSINVRLTLIALIPMPIIVGLTALLTRRMSSGFESVQARFAELTERVREAFSGIRVIKSFHRQAWAEERVAQEGRRYVSENMKLARTLAFFFPMMAVVTNAGLAIVIWLGGRLTILGQITTGDFVAFTSYLNLLTWPMMAMGWVTNLIQRGSASMRRINRILEEPAEIRSPATPAQPGPPAGDIEVRGLSFRYPGQSEDVLRGVSFGLRPGETVALVGRVGSGKSTLLQALPRLWDVPPGTVFIGGRDICSVPLPELRQAIGFVTQESFLFSDTVRNNVLFGRPDIREQDLEASLKAAGIWEEIRELESGLDTLLGERGITLSGGQRQRLTLARALLCDPPILILDDPLSMVDTRTEAAILDHLLRVRRQRCNLIVSHRVSTISRADRILVLDGGRLIEQGSHRELLERGGTYARLYQRQLLLQELENGFD